MDQYNQLSSVSTILSIGTIIMPIVFGFGMWKMSQIFVTKEDFVDWKSQQLLKETDIKKSIEKLGDKIDRLLEREIEK